MQFDAAHYETIANSGYEGFLAAFFPLFPLIWKALGVGPIGISIMNGLIYAGAFWFLWREVKPGFRTTLLWCLAPGVLFYSLPYSESVFFASAVVIIVGVRRDSLALVCGGLLACTLARPAFSVLVPALVAMEVLCTNRPTRLARNMAAYIVTSALGLWAVAAIQHADTGCWTCFYSVQSGWGNGFRLPSVPLNSWGGAIPVRLDALALLVGLIAFGALARDTKRRMIGQQLADRNKVLAVAYLAGISFMVLFMRGGELFSLNRFVFATPFFLIFLAAGEKVRIVSTWRTWLLSWTALMTYFLLFGSYVHIQVALGYSLLSALVVMVVMSVVGGTRHVRWHITVSTSLLFLLQVLLLSRYLTGAWVA